MLSIIIVIAIVLLSIVLAGIGIYVGTRNSDEKEEPKPVIDVSGQYAAIGRPARETITAVKPSEASIMARDAGPHTGTKAILHRAMEPDARRNNQDN